MRTLTSYRLIADSELRYTYEGSKTLMHVFDGLEDTDFDRGIIGRHVCRTARNETKEIQMRLINSRLPGHRYFTAAPSQVVDDIGFLMTIEATK